MKFILEGEVMLGSDTSGVRPLLQQAAHQGMPPPQLHAPVHGTYCMRQTVTFLQSAKTS